MVKIILHSIFMEALLTYWYRIEASTGKKLVDEH